MEHIKKILSFTFCIFFLTSVWPQSANEKNEKKVVTSGDYRAVHWGVDEGLSKVRWHTAMLKDINGFLWLGSHYGEVSRFDGSTFKQYYPDKNKKGNIISTHCWALVEDSLHNIWIGTRQGLSRYDIKADTFTNFHTATKPENLDNLVVPFWATSKEVLCIEGQNQISAYDILSFQRKKLADIKDSDKVGRSPLKISHAIFDSGSNSVWMLPEDEEGLTQFFLSTGKSVFHKRIEFSKKPLPTGHRDAEAMCFDRNRSCIWINSYDGLVQFSLSDQRFHRIDALNPFVKLKDYDRWVGIDIDLKGRIWLATMPEGILIYDPVTNTVSKPISNPALQKEVAEANLKIYCDRDGVVWTSYWSLKEIYQLIPFAPSVKRYAANHLKKDSLISFDISNMVAGKDGELWIGTGYGLNIYNPQTGSFKIIKEKDLPGIKGSVIVPMAIDTVRKKAWLYAGPPDRVYEMDLVTKQCRNVVFKDSLGKVIQPVDIVRFISHPYKNGFLFFDGAHGILQVGADSLVARLVIPFHNAIFRIIAEGGIMFLRTFPNNLTYHNISGKWIKTQHPLDTIGWTEILYDRESKTYWVAADNKLIHYDDNFRVIRTFYDEVDKMRGILTLISDGRGNIWFNNDKKEIGNLNIKTGIITTLSEQDGYQKQWYDPHTAHGAQASGELYFVGNWLAPGVSFDRISPGKFVSFSPASVYFNSLEVKDFPLPRSKGVNNLEELSLKYFQNKINIETGVIDFYSKGRNHIRYKLEIDGENADWQYGPAISTIRYEGLAPGKYKLVMQASNAASEFSGPEKTLLINISPAFWNTWWFRTIGVLALIGIIYGFMQYRSRNLKQTNILLEKKVTARTNELNNSLTELKNTQDQLVHSEKMASLGELTSGIAHEIKNPLNFINNFSEINMDLIAELEEQPNKDVESEQIIKTLKKNSEKINHHGKRVDDIVKSMLQHSRFGNLTKEPVNINMLCAESLKLAYHGFKAKEKTFNAAAEMNFDPDLPTVMVIPQDIGRVLLNLINNAFYAVHEKKKKGLVISTDEAEPEISYKPTVTVSTKRIENKILITVSDNGPGIPQKIINKIFQPFFTTKPTGEGTGLGLSMSYDIVTKSHGGELRVKSIEEEGTDFEMVIPVK